MNFSVLVEPLGSKSFVITLTGEVDLYTAPDFKRNLHDVIDRGAREVVVDLTGATFIDSTFLGVLIGGRKRLSERDGEISVVCGDRNLRKVFEITGLDRIFTIRGARQDTRPDAPSFPGAPEPAS